MTCLTLDRPLTIRRAAPEDLPEVHRMAIALGAGRGAGPLPTRALMQRIAGGQSARILVAFRGDSPQRHPVGYALVLVDRNMIAGADWGFVEQLFVQEPYRGRGIGRALIAAARAEAERLGGGGVTIRSRPEMDAAALAFRAGRAAG